MDWITFSIVLFCLLVSAFFAASETALTGASRASMLRLSKQGNQDAQIVSGLSAMREPLLRGVLLRRSKQGNQDAQIVSVFSAMRERLIGALLLGNNIANIGASALAAGIFTVWFGEVGVLYATAFMTVLVVIFAEVLPKTIAINAPDRVALRVARPMKLMMFLLGPLVTVVEGVVRLLLRLFDITAHNNQPIDRKST